MVVDLAPVEVGVKDNCPVVQVPLFPSTRFAVQVPKAWVNSASELENGVAPKVTLPPWPVTVTVPQVPVVFTVCEAEQLNEEALKVRYAFEVPEMPKVALVPEAAFAVTVSDFAPEEVGLKVMVPVVQELPEAIVEFAVQVPKPTVKSVESEFDKGVALKITAPPLAVNVILPVQVLLEPELTVGQLTEEPDEVSAP
jgi:hypothetical protein